jgi:SAM-dependent methyltransferase
MHSDLLNTREDSRATRDHRADEIISRSQATAALSREYCRCNLCGGDATQRVATQRGFEIHRCCVCGLVYVNPRPKAEELASLYVDYHARDGGDEASWDRLMGRIFRESADLLCAAWNGSRRPRLLDVGCGFGGFVALMTERGWDAEGVDPSPSVVEAATRKGRRIRLGTLEELPRDHGPCDAITMFYVLEHLSDPMVALRKVFDLLVPGGTLLIRVPHTTPIVRLLSPLGLGGALYDPPFHLYDFSPAVLREMLRRLGFVDVRTRPGQPTLSSRLGPRLAAAFFGTLATWLHAVTRGSVLLPGVSKSTMARKPSR